MRSLYVQVYQAIVNYWMGELSPTELRVLLIVNERTLRYNKEEEIIPIRHFTEGVYSRDGDLITNPIPANRSTIVRAYQALVDKQILIVTKHATRNATKNKFAINFNLLIEKALEMANLKTPKKRKESDRECARSTHRGAKGVQQEYTISTEVDKSVDKQPETTGLRPELREVVEKAYQAYKDRRVAKAARANASFSRAAVAAAWATAVQEHHTLTPIATLSDKGFYALRSAFKAHKQIMPVTEFVGWAVAHWTSLKANEMSWCGTMPPSPSIEFFAFFYKYFLAAHNDFVKRQDLEERKRQKRGSELRAAYEELAEAKAETRSLAATAKQAAMERDHFKRLLRERKEKPVREPLKNIEDLKFEEIEPI